MILYSRYTLDELAEKTGLSPRTIRNYIQKGLLPGAETRGRNAFYSEIHLDRLRCIQVIRQQSGLSLDELRLVMQSLGEERIRRIARGEEEVMALPMGQSAPQGEGGARAKGRPRSRGGGKQGRGQGGEGGMSALDYLRHIRCAGRRDESRLAELTRALEELTRGQQVYRKAKNEWWATVKVTEDMEIRVRGLDAHDVGRLERLADLLRHLIMKGGR